MLIIFPIYLCLKYSGCLYYYKILDYLLYLSKYQDRKTSKYLEKHTVRFENIPNANSFTQRIKFYTNKFRLKKPKYKMAAKDLFEDPGKFYN